MPLTVVDHPLVQDRVAILRDESTDRAAFRRATRDLGAFLVYEATRDLATVAGSVRTPLDLDAPVRRIAHPGPVVVPILRAGLGLLEGVLSALPEAEVGVIGLARDEETFRPVAYCERLRDDLAGREAFVLDPMLATGGSLVAACVMLAARGAGRITAVTVLAAPEGVQRVAHALPDVRVVTAALDERLNDHAFIVPGLGDAGDRLFGPPG
ncbi:MAG: uracil phosphoribosyltransferase [Actinomycetota bacterium]|nr:uracil phosphoribosyltransferase [Actinomycetota bacterium]